MQMLLQKQTVRPKTGWRLVVAVFFAACCLLILFQTLTASGQSSGGLIANNLVFNGSSVQVDSFNSSETNHSIWQTNLFFQGKNYGIWSNSLSFDTNSLPSRMANALVATTTNYINVGNAEICGYIKTIPGGTFSVGAQ